VRLAYMSITKFLILKTNKMKSLKNLFPKPKKIDYRKYIQPMYQDFETKNGLTTAILKPLTKQQFNNLKI